MNKKDASFAPAATIRWLFLDMNSFFASCEQQAEPALRGRPVAVVPMLAETTCAIAASYEAKAFGVKTGTLVREARMLCPGIVFVPARPKLYVAFHHKFLDAIERSIPVEDVLSIDEVACRLDRRQQDPAVALDLARQIKADLRALVGECLTCSIGLAGNRLLAKLASDMQKPDGLVLLRPEEMPGPILGLKPNAICGIGPRMTARLDAAGLSDMEALWEASPALLRRVWGGVMGARFHALLHGVDLPSPSHPRRSMGHQHVLPPESRTLPLALPIARELLVRAAARLRREAFFCRRLTLIIKWDGFGGYCVEEATFPETQDTRALLAALMTLWRRVPGLRPLRVGVTLAELAPAALHQLDLFENKKGNALAALVDRVNEKFGRGTLLYGGSALPIPSKIAFSRVPGREEV